jgi:hypothetical protein
MPSSPDYWLLAPYSSLWGLLVTDYWLENTRIRKTENQSRTENMAKTHGSQ